MRNFIFLCFNLLMICKIQACQYELSMCCIFQNEDRFLKEWIDYHRLIGVEHFYMYNNQSADNFAEILKPYVEEGIVECILWDKGYGTPEDWWRVQRNAYIDAIKRSIGVSKWLCIIDTDEFIVPIQDNNLKGFLHDFEAYGGVYINWVFYGASGIQRVPDGEWITKSFLKRAKLNHSGHRLVKSIVCPERVDLEKSSFPHTCAYLPPYFHVNPDHKQPVRGKPKDIIIDRIRINHYWSRDLDYLIQDKYERNKRWYGEQRAINKVNSEKEMNDFYDPLILEVINRFEK